MTSKHKELEALHFELASLYRRNSNDTGLIADYWLEIESTEEELGVEK